LVLAAGCDFPGKPDPANRPKMPDQIVNFDVLFRQNCAGCHGAEGKLGAAPPLNDPLFLAIATKDDLLSVISQGRSGTPMPAFVQAQGGSLTDEQASIIALGIHARWKSAPKSDALPAYRFSIGGHDASAAGDLGRGAKLFASACAGCHGENGTGGAAGAIHDADFLSLMSDQALRRIIITGRPDLGMPTYAEQDGRGVDFEPLTSDQINDLVSLLASWRTAGRVAQNQRVTARLHNATE
jgi:mono/diheme cytochrome c family protein